LSDILFNPIQLSSRDFDSILADINSDSELVDKPDWFKRLIAGLGDVLTIYINATANNTLLSTAFTRRNVAELLALIDYFLLPQSTATGNILFYLKSTAVFPVSVAQADLVALTQGTLSQAAKRFEARGGVTIPAVTDTFTDSEVNTGTNEITVTRDFTTGEKIRLTTAGTIPSPLAINTDYWVIRVSATVIQLSTTLANAYNGVAINLTAAGSGTNTINIYSSAVTVYQQEALSGVILGPSNGVDVFQEYTVPDENVLDDTMEIIINSIPWTKVTTLVDSQPTDQHYRLIYNSDNSAIIQFGDGTYGEIPGNFDIIANYATGGGSDSNVSRIDGINVYAGGDTNIEGVSNPVAITGGANEQNTEEAKVIGPLLLKARDRYVTIEDGEALAISYPGIAQATSIPNAFGPNSAKMLTIANGGGNPDTATKASLEQFLIDRTTLQSIDVKVEDTTITSTDVTSAAKVLLGFSYTGGVDNYFRLAWKLFLSEAGNEIKNDWIENGVESATVLINSIFSESFGSSDYSTINILITNLTPREIGISVEESDAFAYFDQVPGVDYVTITLPSFPITLAEDEITTDGTLTLSEIV